MHIFLSDLVLSCRNQDVAGEGQQLGIRMVLLQETGTLAVRRSVDLRLEPNLLPQRFHLTPLRQPELAPASCSNKPLRPYIPEALITTAPAAIYPALPELHAR